MTTKVTKLTDIKRHWHLIDVEGQVLGRISSKIAQLLIGKNKVYFTPSLDCGDYVVITNAKKVKVTGKKYDQKMYYRHSNYPGGFRKETFKQVMAKNPRKIIIEAVKNMLPKNRLRDLRMKRLKIFIDDNHIYADKFKKPEESKQD
jgi:large subunit ribosomal protein L13